MNDTNKLDDLFREMNLDGGQNEIPPPPPKDDYSQIVKSLSKVAAQEKIWICLPIEDTTKFLIKELNDANSEEFLAWCKLMLPFIEPDDSIINEKRSWPSVIEEIIRIRNSVRFPVNLHERIRPEKKKSPGEKK